MCKLKALRNGLVVSCQPVNGGPMDTPEIVAAMARAAMEGGANGVRLEGAENVAFARALISAPIIGIIKRDLATTPVRITPLLSDVALLAEAGADIIAFDATARDRPVARDALAHEIRKLGLISMADCATLKDAKYAIELGVDIVGTTLSGYTDETSGLGSGPDLKLVGDLRGLGAFVMAEGRFATPALAAAAVAEGADCVTVGTPLTRLEVNTASFHRAISVQAAKDD